MTKANKKILTADRIKDLVINKKVQYALAREDKMGVSSRNLSGGGIGSGGSGNVDSTKFLRTAGDTMVGPLAFFPKLVTIASGVIDIKQPTDREEAGSYSSSVIVSTEAFATTDDLDTIDEAKFQGQIIFIQGTTTQTITLTSADNISPIGGSFKLVDDNTVLLKWKSTAGKWEQLTGGEGSMFNPSTTDLDMGGFSIINKKSQTYNKVTNASIPTPATDKRTVYYSQDIDEMAVKNSGGTVISLEGSGGGGANIFLSNLSVGNVNVNTDMRPDVDDLRDLGSGAPPRSWRDLYINLIRFPNIESNPTNIHAIYRDSFDDISMNVPLNEQYNYRFNGNVKWQMSASLFQGDNILINNLLTFNNNGPFLGFNGAMWNDNGSVHIFSGGADFAIDGLARGDLSNLSSPTLINSDLDPALTNARELGDGTHVWKNLFLQQLRLQPGAITAPSAHLIAKVGTQTVVNIPTGGEFAIYFNGVQEHDFNSSSLTTKNIILSNTFIINNSSFDPNFNGMFARNGDDVKVFTGNKLVNFSTIGGPEFSDANFKIFDNIDPSRKVQFQTGGIAAGMTRTLIIQNASGIVALLDGAITQVSNNDWQFNGVNFDIGNSTSDRLTIKSRIDSDVLPSVNASFDLGSSSREWFRVFADEVHPSDRVRAAGSSEIGFLVENGTGSIGTEGTVQLPYTNSSPGSDAGADTRFGAFKGAVGFQKAGTGGLLYIRDDTGNWSLVATANAF